MTEQYDNGVNRAVLYAPGLRQPLRKVKPFLDTLAERGIQVITPEKEGFFSHRSLDAEFRDELESWPRIQLAKANMLYHALLDSEVERADVVGYCEGGVTSTILAYVHPEMVSQLVLVNPAGMTKEDGPERLVNRFKNKNHRYVKAIIEDILTGEVTHSTYEMVWSNVNRVLGMRALASLSEVYMADILNSLAEGGMKISMLHGYKDRLYPYEDVSQNVPESLHAYASFADSAAGHAVFDTHTNETISAVTHLLDL